MIYIYKLKIVLIVIVTIFLISISLKTQATDFSRKIKFNSDVNLKKILNLTVVWTGEETRQKCEGRTACVDTENNDEVVIQAIKPRSFDDAEAVCHFGAAILEGLGAKAKEKITARDIAIAHLLPESYDKEPFLTKITLDFYWNETDLCPRGTYACAQVGKIENQKVLIRAPLPTAFSEKQTVCVIGHEVLHSLGATHKE